MMPFLDGCAASWLPVMVDWSIRWGMILLTLAAWFAWRPPRLAASRHRLCLAMLIAGSLLPVAPRWGDAVVPWPFGRDSLSVGSGAHPANISPLHPPIDSINPIREQTRSNVIQALPARTSLEQETRRRTTDAPTLAQILVIAAFGVWSAVVLFKLAQLVCGGVVLSRLRRGATPIQEREGELLNSCLAMFGLSRHVGLAIHPGVVSPIVTGGRRPLILVPPDWTEWSESDRRACLLHELAHLSRYDDWTKVFQELLRAPFFFHPLVQWLMARLDRERELLCDEAAVALGTDPIAYARLLFELARRPGGRLAVAAAPSPQHWLPFLDQRTVKVRIERLLEKNMAHSLSTISVVRPALLVPLVLALTVGLGGLRIRSLSAEVSNPPPEQKAVTADSSPVGNKPDGKEISGVVIDSDGIPIQGATVVAGLDKPGSIGHTIMTTNADGRFRWLAPKGSHPVVLLVHDEGSTIAIFNRDSDRVANPQNLSLRVQKPEQFKARLVDAGGQPVSGAKIQVSWMATASVSEKGAVTETMVCFTAVPWTVVKASPFEPLFSAATAADGSFSLDTVRPKSGLLLEGTDADGRRFRVKSRDPVKDLARQTMEGMGFVSASPDGPVELLMVPAAQVAGRVLSTLPGVGISRLTVSYQESRQRGNSQPTGNFYGGETITDADGRFAFDNLAEGTINIVVHGPGMGEAWTYRAAKDVVLTPGHTSLVEIKLIPGIEVTGKVIEHETGKPLEGVGMGSYGPFRPDTSAITFGVKTDSKGVYKYRLPSGSTYFYVMDHTDGYDSLPNQKSSRTVTIPDDVIRFEVEPIELTAAAVFQATLVDADGRPIEGAKVGPVLEFQRTRNLSSTEVRTDAEGRFPIPKWLFKIIGDGEPVRLSVHLANGSEPVASSMLNQNGDIIFRAGR